MYFNNKVYVNKVHIVYKLTKTIIITNDLQEFKNTFPAKRGVRKENIKCPSKSYLTQKLFRR